MCSLLSLTPNGPAIKGVCVAERLAAGAFSSYGVNDPYPPEGAKHGVVFAVLLHVS
jgi:hypothetical protein